VKGGKGGRCRNYKEHFITLGFSMGEGERGTTKTSATVVFSYI